MEEKKSFLMYTEMRPQLALLTNEQAGELFKAVVAYVDSGEMLASADVTVQVMFSFLCQSIDRNNAKYREVCERRSASGKKGGRPRTESLLPEEPVLKEANGFSEVLKKPNGFSEVLKKPDNEPVPVPVPESVPVPVREPDSDSECVRECECESGPVPVPERPSSSPKRHDPEAFLASLIKEHEAKEEARLKALQQETDTQTDTHTTHTKQDSFLNNNTHTDTHTTHTNQDSFLNNNTSSAGAEEGDEEGAAVSASDLEALGRIPTADEILSAARSMGYDWDTLEAEKFLSYNTLHDRRDHWAYAMGLWEERRFPRKPAAGRSEPPKPKPGSMTANGRRRIDRSKEAYLACVNRGLHLDDDE